MPGVVLFHCDFRLCHPRHFALANQLTPEEVERVIRAIRHIPGFDERKEADKQILRKLEQMK